MKLELNQILQEALAASTTSDGSRSRVMEHVIVEVWAHRRSVSRRILRHKFVQCKLIVWNVIRVQEIKHFAGHLMSRARLQFGESISSLNRRRYVV